MIKPITSDTLQTKRFSFRGPLLGKGQECALIMRSLPDWFGIEEYIVSYSTEIDRLPTWLITDGEQLIGFLSLKQHFATLAKVCVMAE